MSKPNTLRLINESLEPELHVSEAEADSLVLHQTAMVAQISAAISLKRIADALQAIPSKEEILEMVYDIRRALGPRA